MKPDDEGRTLKSSLARLIMPRSVYEQTTRVIMVNRSATEAPWCCAYVIFENFSTVNEGEDMIGRARVETGKSWRNETPTSRGLFRMALKIRNETGN